jgi:hypothetical protein
MVQCMPGVQHQINGNQALLSMAELCRDQLRKAFIGLCNAQEHLNLFGIIVPHI